MGKINIAELFKDCPKGMKLYSPIFGDVYLDKIRPNLAIVVTIDKEQGDFKEEFLYDGRYGINGECMLFPSKGKTTWEGFQRPFKDGDIVAFDNPYRERLEIFIFKDKKENNTLSTCYLMLDGDELYLEEGMYYITRLATEEEKEKLFKAIKDNGYQWNEKTKTLKKLIEPKFKVGDKVRPKKGISEPRIIKDVCDTFYTLVSVGKIDFTDQNNWELVPNKFDINTLVPFESKVLVRDTDRGKWKSSFWGFYDTDTAITYPYECCGILFAQCIPYEGNEHLLGTNNDCNEYYKTWK